MKSGFGKWGVMLAAAGVLTTMFSTRAKASPEEKAVAVEEPSVPTTNWNNPDSINWEEKFSIDGGPVGIRREFVTGRGCDDGYTRTYYETKIWNGNANCYVIDWASSDPFDCRVIVHLGQQWWAHADCQLDIYQNHETQP